MKTKNIFKIGDIVLALKNSAWGTKPMKVRKIYGSGKSKYYSCSHPTWGVGEFDWDELVSYGKSDSSRNKKLKELEELHAKVNSLTTELFGKDN